MFKKINGYISQYHQWMYKKLGIPWVLYFPMFIIWMIFGGKLMVHLIGSYPGYWFAFDFIYSLLGTMLLMILACNTSKPSK